jgi:hypothetical protein
MGGTGAVTDFLEVKAELLVVHARRWNYLVFWYRHSGRLGRLGPVPKSEVHFMKEIPKVTLGCTGRELALAVN